MALRRQGASGRIATRAAMRPRCQNPIATLAKAFRTHIESRISRAGYRFAGSCGVRWGFAIAACAAILIPFGAPAAGNDRGYVRLQIDGHVLSWAPDSAGQPVTLTWALAEGELETQGARNCQHIGPTGRLARRFGESVLRQEIGYAFDYWQQAAAIRFRPIEDWRQADIVIGAQLAPSGIAFANVSYEPGPGEGVGRITRSLICLNPEADWKIGFDGNLRSHDLRFVVAHEIGHAIGLDHPGPSGQLMSFRYEERFRGLQGGDIAGAVAIYGPAQDAPAQGVHAKALRSQDLQAQDLQAQDRPLRDRQSPAEFGQSADSRDTSLARAAPSPRIP